MLRRDGLPLLIIYLAPAAYVSPTIRGPGIRMKNAREIIWFHLDGTFFAGGSLCGKAASSIGENLHAMSYTVAEHVLCLRRYARALTGDQTSGDSYVAAMLEALIKDTALALSPASGRSQRC
jgi:hypothetical protein